MNKLRVASFDLRVKKELPKRHRGDDRGVSLVMSLVALALFSLMALTINQVSRSQARESIHVMRQAQAQAIAEAGIENALYELLQNPTWRDGFQDKPFAGGTYTVSLSTDSVPWITSTGYSPRIAVFGPRVKTVRARSHIRKKSPIPCPGHQAQSLFAAEGLIAAYDSAADPDAADFLFGGHVWSNGEITTPTTGSNILIRGDACYQTGASPQARRIQGSVGQSTYSLVLASHDGSAFKDKNDNLTGLSPQSVYDTETQEIFVPSGQTALLKPGVYYFKKIAVEGTLTADTADGTITIYLAENLESPSGNGRIVNSSKSPARLLFYGQGTAAMNLRFAEPLMAVIESPKGQININGNVYGKVTGDQVRVENSGILLFDRQLEDGAASHAQWEPGTWSCGYQKSF
ncbi:MAG: hypothetical protein HY547_02695 [Elusimicrobia bacterium]|nr:hypothetical protein [Elusimicrobiota bacterium]